MKAIAGVMWEALKELWDELHILVPMSLVTVVLTLPVVTFPPAVAALWCAGERAVKPGAVRWEDYWNGFRRYFWKAWGLALVNVAALVIWGANMWFYAPDVVPFDLSRTWSDMIRALWLSLGVLWLMCQMYSLAMLLQLKEERVILALRNSVGLFLSNPGFAVLLALFLLGVAIISSVLPILWVLVTPALLAVVCSKAVQYLLEPFRQRAQDEDATQGP